MADAIGPSAPSPSSSPRPLPPRPSLEHLKIQAKERLDELRTSDPAAQLSDAQFAIAREYGFTSWRALKAHVESLSNLGTRLLHACDRGDAEDVRSLLQSHPALIATTDERGYISLHRAVAAGDRPFTPGHADAVRQLLAAGADVSARAENGNIGACTPLHLAAFSGRDRLEAIRLLIAAGADVNVTSSNGSTPLFDAARHGAREMAEALLSAGAVPTLHDAVAMDRADLVDDLLNTDPEAINRPHPYSKQPPIALARSDGMRARLVARGAQPSIHDAAQAGWTEMVRRLLDAQPDLINQRNARGRTPLHDAIDAGSLELIDLLLSRGADVSARWEPGPGWTPLELARRRGRADVAARLELHASAPVGGRDLVDEVIDAARAGRVDELRTLLDAHPYLVNARNAGNGSALQHAAWRNRGACVRLLLDRGADVTLRVGEGDLAVHYAAETADLDVVRMLVEAGSDLTDDRDHHRLGVLGWATCFGARREVAEYLLSRGARHTLWSAVAMDEVDVLRGMLDADPALVHARMTPGDHRRTPLHLAVRRSAIGAAELLLARGADVHATDHEGLTPIASQVTDRRIVELLLRAGARLDFAAALCAGRFDIAERLLADDPGRLAPGGRDADALTRAVQRGDRAAARWLLEHGADVNAKSDVGEQGATPLHHAVLRDDPPLIELLLSHGADPSIEDDHYHGTSLGWANYTNQPKAAAFLRGRGIVR